MQCFVVVLMFFAQLLPISLQGCIMCRAGEFRKSCTVCVPCPAGSFTTVQNREISCHRCYGDCRPDYHLKVVKNCSSTSDMKCICEDGYTCTDLVPLSNNCRYCKRTKEATTVEAAGVITEKDKHTLSSASSGHSSTSAKSCRFPPCNPLPVPQAGNGTHPKTDMMKSPLVLILCPVIFIFLLALVILPFVRCHGDESCFKEAMSKLCKKGGQDASHKPKESTHQHPRDSFSAKQQPSSLPAANLGPVHVHNPGTVFVSLLNQFTGQVGPTIEGLKTEERSKMEEEEERDCPVCHPTPSDSVNLSEEERSVEIDSMFHPSQEQGKDCHVSKEEVLWGI